MKLSVNLINRIFLVKINYHKHFGVKSDDERKLTILGDEFWKASWYLFMKYTHTQKEGALFKIPTAEIEFGSSALGDEYTKR